jgi:hypothetical protein
MTTMAVREIVAGRMRPSEFAHNVVMLCRRYSPSVVALEKSLTYETLGKEILLCGAKYETNIPLFFAPISNRRGAKFLRLKSLEILLNQGRLLFCSTGPWLDTLFAELERLDGGKSSSSKKDDRADSLGLCAKLFLPESDAAEDTAATQRLLEAQEARLRMQANYERIFGAGNDAPLVLQPAESSVRSNNPVTRMLGGAYR